MSIHSALYPSHLQRGPSLLFLDYDYHEGSRLSCRAIAVRRLPPLHIRTVAPHRAPCGCGAVAGGSSIHVSLLSSLATWLSLHAAIHSPGLILHSACMALLSFAPSQAAVPCTFILQPLFPSCLSSIAIRCLHLGSYFFRIHKISTSPAKFPKNLLTGSKLRLTKCVLRQRHLRILHVDDFCRQSHLTCTSSIRGAPPRLSL